MKHQSTAPNPDFATFIVDGGPVEIGDTVDCGPFGEFEIKSPPADEREYKGRRIRVFTFQLKTGGWISVSEVRRIQ